MNVCISAHHIEMTVALEDYVKEKMQKLWQHFEIISARFRLVADPAKKIAQADIQIKGKTVHIEESHEDMYAAIDKLINVLHQVLAKTKEKVKRKNRKQRGVEEK